MYLLYLDYVLTTYFRSQVSYLLISSFIMDVEKFIHFDNNQRVVQKSLQLTVEITIEGWGVDK